MIKQQKIQILFFVCIFILTSQISAILSVDLNNDLVQNYNDAHTETDPNGLLPLDSKILSIKGTTNIEIIPDNPENTKYLKISSVGEGALKIKSKQKEYGFLLSGEDSIILNAISSKIKEGSFSALPFTEDASEFLFENGKIKISKNYKIEYFESNAELTLKTNDFIILSQNNLENFNIEAFKTLIPYNIEGRIYPINANLKTKDNSNLKYLGSSYEIPSVSEVKINYGKLILPNNSKVMGFSKIGENFLGNISEKLGFKFDKNKLVSFSGKNIDLGNGLIAEIPEKASINFDEEGNLLAGHTGGKKIKFNNNIDLQISGTKSQVEGVYIFNNLDKAKSSGHKNFITFGEDFNAQLGETSKSGSVNIGFNEKNPYIPVKDNAYFSLLGGRHANEKNSKIKIRKYNPIKKTIAVADNEGFAVLNDDTRSTFIFDNEGNKKSLRVDTNNYGRDQVPILVRNHLDQKNIENPEQDHLEIASLYTNIAKRVHFTSNLAHTKTGVLEGNLAYRKNFEMVAGEKIPFMQDVFKEDVQVTLDTVAMVEDNEFIQKYQDYEPNYIGFKKSQKENKEKYLALYTKLAGNDEAKGKAVFEEANRIVNNPSLSFKERNAKLSELYQNELGLDYFPTLKNVNEDFKRQAAVITKFYYDAEKKGYIPPEAGKFSLDNSEIKKIDDLVEKGYSIDDAIYKTIGIGPNMMFSDPKIPAQEWWSLRSMIRASSN